MSGRGASHSEESADTGRQRLGAVAGWMESGSESPASTPLRLSPAPPPPRRRPRGAASGLPAPADTPVAAKSAKRKAAEALLAARHVRSTAAAAKECISQLPFAAFSAARGLAAPEHAEHEQHPNRSPALHSVEPACKFCGVGKRPAKVQRRETSVGQQVAPQISSGVAAPHCRACGEAKLIEAAAAAAAAVAVAAAAASRAVPTWVTDASLVRRVNACEDSAACCIPAHHAEPAPAAPAHGVLMVALATLP